MVSYEVKFEEIFAHIDLPDKFNYKAIIFCQKFPGNNEKDELISSFASEGYIVMQPKYLGTGKSEGLISIENFLETIKKSKDFLLTGNAEDLKSKEKIKWETREIILMGVSFGASLALISGAKDERIKKVIALSPIIDFKEHGKNPEIPEADYFQLYNLIAENHKAALKGFNFDDWYKVCSGQSCLNPIEYFNSLKEKEILFIHGKQDLEINFSRTVSFYESLKKLNPGGKFSLKLTEDANHEDLITKCLSDIRDWLK